MRQQQLPGHLVAFGFASQLLHQRQSEVQRQAGASARGDKAIDNHGAARLQARASQAVFKTGVASGALAL